MPGVPEIRLIRNWEDAWTAGLGIEWSTPSGRQYRGGYFYDQSAVPTSTILVDGPDANKHSLAVGATFPMRPGLALDVAAEYWRFSPVHTTDSVYDTPDPLVIGVNSDGTYRTSLFLRFAPGVPPTDRPKAAFGVCEPKSPGKDSTTGHWEICGLVLDQPFPTYPAGLSRRGHRRVLPTDGTGSARQQGGVRHGDPRRVRRGAPALRAVDRLHLGRQRLPGGRARVHGAARGALCRVRGGERAAAWRARRFAGDRAPVHGQRPGRGSEPAAQGLQSRAAGRHSARPAGRSAHSRASASARWTISSPVAASPASTRRPTARRTSSSPRRWRPCAGDCCWPT